MNRLASRLPAIVEQHQQEILAEWVKLQLETGTWRAGRLVESQLREESQRFLALLVNNIQKGVLFDARSSQWSDIREFLGDLSRSRATQGFSPSQVATFVFSLKQPIFSRLRASLIEEAGVVATGSSIAVIDITGVPTVDTLVAQHLLKTVSAAQGRT